MEYRLYVNVKCKNPRNLKSNIGIGGVILNNKGEQFSYSKDFGLGSCCEAHIYGILEGIDRILELNNAKKISIYSSNLMLIDYFNMRKNHINSHLKELADNLNFYISKMNLDIEFNYFDSLEYQYVSVLAEDAINF